MPDHPGADRRRIAIIDIGSNSIRLVVFEGPRRAPGVLFNEKVMAGLGRGLAESGRIDDKAMALAAPALARFAALAREMDCDVVRTVATAAVRDASNGAALIALAERAGLAVEVLSGSQEAIAAGHGVLSAFPSADGVVGDLGGGSLELVRIAGGAVLDQASFPLGVLRLSAITGNRRAAFQKRVDEALRSLPWAREATGRPFYVVGGSWRALARFDLVRRAYPLPIINGYTLPPRTVDELALVLPSIPRAELRDVVGLSSSRIPFLGDAAMLLSRLLSGLGSSEAVVSAFGVREGLLHAGLSAADRAIDPLIAAVADEGRREGRFPEHGDLLDRWIAPMFASDTPADRRLRLAACWLADTGWRANPEYRAERAAEIALHGNWVGIDARERVVIATTLAASFGARAALPPALTGLAKAAELDRAVAWAAAIRLAQRLSGGVSGPLERSRLHLASDGTIELHLQKSDAALSGETVEKRLRALGAALDRPVRLAMETME